MCRVSASKGRGQMCSYSAATGEHKLRPLLGSKLHAEMCRCRRQRAQACRRAAVPPPGQVTHPPLKQLTLTRDLQFERSLMQCLASRPLGQAGQLASSQRTPVQLPRRANFPRLSAHRPQHPARRGMDGAGRAADRGAGRGRGAAAQPACAATTAAVTTFFPAVAWAKWTAITIGVYLLYWVGLARLMPK